MKKTNKKNNEILNKVKEFFNKPSILIIALIILDLVMIYNYNALKNSNKIYTANVEEKEILIPSIHIFLNNDMNYFYASKAEFAGENKDIYSYDIGYYVKDDKNKDVSFASRKGKLEKKAELKEVVNDMSGWDFGENKASDYFFKDDVVNNLDKLHFVIKACSKKECKTPDINYTYKVDLKKITR